MHLTYLPDTRSLFLWGAADQPPPHLTSLCALGRADSARLVTARGRAETVIGWRLPLQDALPVLAGLGRAHERLLPASVMAWSLAAKLALELVARERMVPRLLAQGAQGDQDDQIEARMAVSLTAPDDAARVTRLAHALPTAAHAVALGGHAGAKRGRRRPRAAWAPATLLRAFLDDVADALVRAAAPASARRKPRGKKPQPWELRLVHALAGADACFPITGFQERSLADELSAWVAPALGRTDVLRACFRLEMPAGDAPAADAGDAPAADADETFLLRFLLQAPDDPGLLVPATDVWAAGARGLARLGRAFARPEESLLRALGAAARLFPPIGAVLHEPRPERVTLDPAAAWAFLSEGGPALAEAGFGVIVPAELTPAGERRLRLRMRLGPTSRSQVAGAVQGTSALGMEELVKFRWEAALGADKLSARELAALARRKEPLVRYRGQWVVVDPAVLHQIQRRLSARTGTMSRVEALAAALVGELHDGGLPMEVVPDGRLATLLERLRRAPAENTAAPRALRGSLRLYQARGLAWLRTMGELGLGACLADDMGLGKTIQVLALLLAQRETRGGAPGPCLLVAPTSVVGNWEREIERFAPSLPVVRHYGSERTRAESELAAAGAVVLTTYAILRRDAKLLAAVDWSTVVLDEAQSIKNATSATARVARRLRAAHRIALSGTPVENRLAELWSILEFLDPGLLGSLDGFRRTYAVPIERYGDEAAAARLRRLVSPFVLRRIKRDPAIIQDLPDKNEGTVVCTLTREQAALYQATVNEVMEDIEGTEGIERRGRVLALLTALKQICNHPAQYLSELGPLSGRSGKLERLTEMLAEALSAGDRALVFTQYREMGERLVSHLSAVLGEEVMFLHGGTPRARRDEMIRRFQEQDATGPRIFVLSLKAGGLGLNLTAASHVFHFDRWWNPAVEDQATDRAYRIGQTRMVQVHKLMCAGTVEEKIDALLARKRDLADRIIGAGEHWITELDDAALRELITLAPGAASGADDGASERGGSGPPALRKKRAKRAPRAERATARQRAARETRS